MGLGGAAGVESAMYATAVTKDNTADGVKPTAKVTIDVEDAVEEGPGIFLQSPPAFSSSKPNNDISARNEGAEAARKISAVAR